MAYLKSTLRDTHIMYGITKIIRWLRRFPRGNTHIFFEREFNRYAKRLEDEKAEQEEGYEV